MFPTVRFLQLYLYDWCILIGIVAALIVFRVYCDKKKIPVKLQNLCLVDAVLSIVVGFLCAVLFQGIYDFTQTGEFVLDEYTGMTFYGGFISGAATFLILYATVIRKLCGENAKAHAGTVTNVAACSVAIAHACGRIGCLMAGCCYGKETDSWIGIFMPAVGAKVIPTQLFEALFLFLLFAVLTVLLFRTKLGTFGVYLAAYGVFRFILEFFRGDDRGASIIPALSPSQLWAILLFLLGAAIVTLSELKRRNLLPKKKLSDSNEPNDGEV